MRKTLLNIAKAAVMAAFVLFFAGIVSSNTLAQTRKPVGAGQRVSEGRDAAYPDFAFPETVSAKSREAMQKSLEEGKPVAALREAMNLIAARNIISGTSVNENAALLDSLSGVLQAPYTQLASLLEAALLTQYYESSSWVFSQRVLPDGEIPGDIAAWSKTVFSDKVTELVERAASDSGISFETPLKEILPLLSDYGFAEKHGLGVYDFIVGRACGCLAAFAGPHDAWLPFGPEQQAEGSGILSPRKYAGELWDGLIERRKTGGNNFALAAALIGKAESMGGSERGTFLNEWTERLLHSEACALMFHALGEYGITPEAAREMDLTGLAGQWEREFPDSEFLPLVESEVMKLTHSSANVIVPETVLPGREAKARIRIDNSPELYVLVYRVAESKIKGDAVSAPDIYASGRPVKAIQIDTDSALPFSIEKEFTLPALDRGLYAAVPYTADALDQKWLKENRKRNYQVFTVSGITFLSSFSDSKKDSGRLYVVDGLNQRPVPGAKVEFYDRRNSRKVVRRAVTDESGSVAIGEGYHRIRVSSGKDVVYGAADSYCSDYKRRKETRATVLTDLAVYKPGDRAGFAAVVWESDGKERGLVQYAGIKAVLRDANWNSVDTLELKTDTFGRASGEFPLPASGLLGRYAITIVREQNGAVREIGSAGFEVAEYKSPTFLVDVKAEPADDAERNGSVRFTGEVLSYSGMPVGAAEVDYKISWSPYWRFNSNRGAAVYSSSSPVDANGHFAISLPTAEVIAQRYGQGLFNLTVTAVSAAGESQTSLPLRFTLSEELTLRPAIPLEIEAKGEKIVFKAEAVDMLGLAVKESVDYSIKDSAGKRIAGGTFTTPLLEVPSRILPSGEYTVSMTLRGDTTEYKERVVVWRKGDEKPPCESVLWVPEKEKTFTGLDKEVKVTVGTSYTDSWILAVISRENGDIERRWYPVSGVNRKIPIPVPSADERLWVTFIGMHGLERSAVTVSLIPERQTREMDVEVVSFRDKVTAGDVEKWSFRFKDNGGKGTAVAAMAAMSNKALEAVAPFKWNLWFGGYDLYNRTRWNYPEGNVFISGTFTELPKYVAAPVILPEWETYGQSFAGRRRFSTKGVYLRGMAETAEVAVEEDAAPAAGMVEMKSMKMMNSAMSYDSAAKTEATAADAEYDGGAPDSGEQLRPVEMPLAFFMPSLVSESDGTVNVEFRVPDFNTTWQFQIAGYDKDLLSAAKVLDAVASKPVMVQANLPRFLRTGDRAVVTASVFNNSSEAVEATPSLEVADMLTGNVIAQSSPSNLHLKPGEQGIVTVSFIVPSNLAALTVTAKATAGKFTDGERGEVAVLTSSAPAVDSKTFYMGSGKKTVSLKMQSPAEANVTLRYCSNPLWECLLALPAGETANGKDAISISGNLSGLTLASGIVSHTGYVVDGLRRLFGAEGKDSRDHSSPLLNDSLFKILPINSTPWVNDAASETMRIHSLSSLLDKEATRNKTTALADWLNALQNPDGGFSWCSGMQSSEFITRRVLDNLATVVSYGLPEGTSSLVGKAVAYVDAEAVRNWERNGKKFDTVEMMRWLYTRRLLGSNESGKFKMLSESVLKSVEKDWRGFGIYDKATAALLLMGKPGMEPTAASILESLRQTALKNPETGWSYDNLRGGVGPMPALESTARVLEAFCKYNFDVEATEGIRQWLLISKSAENWGKSNRSAEIVNAIMRSLPAYDGEAGNPEILVDGKTVELPAYFTLTGNVTVNLDGAAPRGGVVTVRKDTPQPAWGGIVRQYVAPVKDVKAESCSDLSVAKTLVVTDVSGKPSKRSQKLLKVGDKVRITLTINATRDLEYVAVSDTRSACLEPVDQTSGYEHGDGLQYYRETRNTGTNLFIPYLPKGVHILHYDCTIDREGTYSLGIATAQSQYQPTVTAHSAGTFLTVSRD